MRIVNVVARAALGHALNLQSLAKRFPDLVGYNWKALGAATVRLSGVSVMLFKSGKMMASGARSALEAKQALSRVARTLSYRCPRKFTVVNVVATWQVGAREAAEVYRLEDPHAFVKVNKSGYVFCTGVKSKAEVERVRGIIQ